MRAFLPGAVAVEVLRRADRARLGRLEASDSGLFEGVVSEHAPYLLRITWPAGVQETEDPYSFGPVLGEMDLHLFNEGRHFKLAEALGANVTTVDGVRGTRFAVWAPNAERVAVVGDFNTWDLRRHPMRLRHPAGVWELFVPRVAEGMRYKFDILGAGGMRVTQKADPLAKQTEMPPATASVVASPVPFRWCDDEWMRARARRHAPRRVASRSTKSISAHGCGRRTPPRRPRCGTSRSTGLSRISPTWASPMSNSCRWPSTRSAGRGATSAHASTRRPRATARPTSFSLSRQRVARGGIGIIIDWVPAHFPRDEWASRASTARRSTNTKTRARAPTRTGARSSSTSAGTRCRNFLTANALLARSFPRIDGLRVDAVASML